MEQPREGISEAPAMVSPPPEPPLAPGHSVLSREEKVEYRDQDGNLLDPEQVKELEGKVSFKTRYETRTRMVDAQGNEISPEQAEKLGVAPPHPDVDGPDSSTVGKGEEMVGSEGVRADESKEASVERSDSGAAKPASEGNEATGA